MLRIDQDLTSASLTWLLCPFGVSAIVTPSSASASGCPILPFEVAPTGFKTWQMQNSINRKCRRNGKKLSVPGQSSNTIKSKTRVLSFLLTQSSGLCRTSRAESVTARNWNGSSRDLGRTTPVAQNTLSAINSTSESYHRSSWAASRLGSVTDCLCNWRQTKGLLTKLLTTLSRFAHNQHHRLRINVTILQP